MKQIEGVKQMSMIKATNYWMLKRDRVERKKKELMAQRLELVQQRLELVQQIDRIVEQILRRGSWWLMRLINHGKLIKLIELRDRQQALIEPMSERIREIEKEIKEMEKTEEKEKEKEKEIKEIETEIKEIETEEFRRALYPERMEGMGEMIRLAKSIKYD